MSQYASRGEAAAILKLRPDSVAKLRGAGAVPYRRVEGAKVEYEYPRSFLEEVMTATGNIPFSRAFAHVCLLVWQYNNQLISSQQAHAKISQLRQQGLILIDKQVTKLLGYNQSSLARWRKQGRIRSVRFQHWQLTLASDVRRLKKLLDELTTYEIASILKISVRTASRHARLGLLQATKVPSGYRARATEVHATAARQQATELAVATYTAATYTTVEAATRLKVPVSTLRYWAKNGVLESMLVDNQCRFPKKSIEALTERFRTITPGFEWLHPAGRNRSKVLWTKQRAASYLGISPSWLNKLSHQNLLPYFVRTPEKLIRIQRDYVPQYLIGLKTFATGNEVTKTVIQDYYAICQDRRLIA